MIAVLTGDIINSAQTPVPEWLPALKSLMGSGGKARRIGKYTGGTNCSCACPRAKPSGLQFG